MSKEDYAFLLDEEMVVCGKPTRAPFGYYGAKQRIARQIVAMLPPHNAWVEAFCGSAALTLAKPPAPIEVINDLNDEIVNLFDQLRDNQAALCRAVKLTPYAHKEFYRIYKRNDNPNDLERARRFLISTMMTVNGTAGLNQSGFSFSQSYTRNNREARVNRWYNLSDRLKLVVERLRRIRVENRDARELLTMFSDRPATLVYLDPPYFVKRGHAYVIDANDEQFHRELLDICAKAKCMLLISSYESDLYSEILREEDGWVTRNIQTNTRDTTGKDYPRTEVLWTNASFEEARTTGAVPIILTAKEEAQRKVNPAR